MSAHREAAAVQYESSRGDIGLAVATKEAGDASAFRRGPEADAPGSVD